MFYMVNGINLNTILERWKKWDSQLSGNSVFHKIEDQNEFTNQEITIKDQSLNMKNPYNEALLERWHLIYRKSGNNGWDNSVWVLYYSLVVLGDFLNYVHLLLL